MCFGGGGSNKAAAQQAAQAKAEEAARQERIVQGRSNIDNAFGQYNDAFYNKYKDDYTNYYAPQLDQQYSRSVDELTAALAGRGMLESSVGAEQMARLRETLADQKANIANQGMDAANALRAKVEQGKNDLYSLNEASADPAGINARAAASSASFAAPQAYSELGNVFASTLSPLLAFQTADQNSINPKLPWNNTLASGSGSSRKVTS